MRRFIYLLNNLIEIDNIEKTLDEIKDLLIKLISIELLENVCCNSCEYSLVFTKNNSIILVYVEKINLQYKIKLCINCKDIELKSVEDFKRLKNRVNRKIIHNCSIYKLYLDIQRKLKLLQLNNNELHCYITEKGLLILNLTDKDDGVLILRVIINFKEIRLVYPKGYIDVTVKHDNISYNTCKSEKSLTYDTIQFNKFDNYYSLIKLIEEKLEFLCKQKFNELYT